MRAEPTPYATRTTCCRASLIAAIALLLGSQVQAQVNKCRIDGRTVFQSSPCPLEPRAVAAAPQASTPQAAVAASGVPKKRTLAELLNERAAPDRSPAPPPEVQSDGYKVLRAKMGA